MKVLLYSTFIVLTMFPVTISAQEENWDVYVSRYEKGVGSTMLNMDLYRMAPVKNFGFVLITGVKFKDCTSDGMPTKEEFENLYLISDSIKKKVAKATLNIPAGAFTYQCERLDYFYVTDTGKLRQTLMELYKTQFPSYKPYISIKPDKEWEAYFKFLYPNEEAKEYMSNQKLVTQLYNAGDRLEKERPVVHWLYFSTESDRKCFTSYAVSKGFKIVAKEKIDRINSPLKLQISRSESMQLASITKTTLELKKQAKRCNGDYDAWESFAIKD